MSHESFGCRCELDLLIGKCIVLGLHGNRWTTLRKIVNFESSRVSNPTSQHVEALGLAHPDVENENQDSVF